MKKNLSIGIVGLGYVGLPLATELAKHFIVSGYDISKQRVVELQNNFDRYNIIEKKDFKKKKKLNLQQYLLIYIIVIFL